MSMYNGKEILFSPRILFEFTPELCEKYFTISGGVVSLKSEYKPNGNKYDTLPRFLAIPDKIAGTIAESFEANMFNGNTKIETLMLPYGITSIPNRFAYQATNLHHIINTAQITTIGNEAFLETSINEAFFPNLTVIGTNAFRNCALMKAADVGKITSLPNYVFRCCHRLKSLNGCKNITSVGEGALFKAFDLDISKTDFELDNLTNAGAMSFKDSGIRHDWESITGCNFGDYATPNVMGFVEGYKDATPSRANVNPLKVFYNQGNPAWAERGIGGVVFDGGIKWKHEEGCVFYSFSVAYAGLKHPSIEDITDPIDVENLMLSDNSGIFTQMPQQLGIVKQFAEEKVIDTTVALNYLAGALGLKIDYYYRLDENGFQAAYDALTDGKYIILFVPTSEGTTQSHAVVAYGVDENGNVNVADSSPISYKLGIYDGATYKVPLENLLATENKLHDFITLVSKVRGVSVTDNKSNTIYIDATLNLLPNPYDNVVKRVITDPYPTEVNTNSEKPIYDSGVYIRQNTDGSIAIWGTPTANVCYALGKANVKVPQGVNYHTFQYTLESSGHTYNADKILLHEVMIGYEEYAETEGVDNGPAKVGSPATAMFGAGETALAFYLKIVANGFSNIPETDPIIVRPFIVDTDQNTTSVSVSVTDSNGTKTVTTDGSGHAKVNGISGTNVSISTDADVSLALTYNASGWNLNRLPKETPCFAVVSEL